MNIRLGLIEADTHWLIPIAGQTVDQCCFDFAVILRLGGDDGWEIRISQPFVVAAPDGAERLVVPEELAHVESVLALLTLAVEEANAYKDGRLELRLAGGAVLHVPPDKGYEAWEAAGPDGMKVISVPGGDLAVWRSTANSGE